MYAKGEKMRLSAKARAGWGWPRWQKDEKEQGKVGEAAVAGRG